MRAKRLATARRAPVTTALTADGELEGLAGAQVADAVGEREGQLVAALGQLLARCGLLDRHRIGALAQRQLQRAEAAEAPTLLAGQPPGHGAPDRGPELQHD